MPDFQFSNADELNNLGSASVRYKQNVEALTILRALKENEGATPSEADLRTLTRYVGWGASELINKAFPDRHGENQPKRSKLYLPKTKSTLYAAQV